MGDMLQNSSNRLSIWETQLKSTHENFDLKDPSCLQEKVKFSARTSRQPLSWKFQALKVRQRNDSKKDGAN